VGKWKSLEVGIIGYGPFDATNGLNHLINQLEERILQFANQRM